MMKDNPVGSLAALMAAYTHNKSNPTILRNLGAILAQISLPEDALAVLDKADTLRTAAKKPMGISELDSERNNKGFALIELRRWGDAQNVLSRAVSDQPLLAEAKINLSLVYLCKGQRSKAAAMFFAGARRNPVTKVDDIGTLPYQNTQVPAGQWLDVSHGRAGTLPKFVYPSTVADVDKDGPTFKNFYEMYNRLEMTDGQKASALLKSLPPRPPATIQRVNDIENAAYNAQMGGFNGLQAKAGKAQARESMLWLNAFGGQCGAACDEAIKIQSAGGDVCKVQHPKMRAWLTGKTEQFARDMKAWDTAQRAEWAAESRWTAAVIANIGNPKQNKAAALDLDSVKQSTMYLMSYEVNNWDQFVEQYDYYGNCLDTLGTAEKPPAETMLNPEDCPQSLKDHSFSFSVAILSLSVNCENITITAEEEGLGPFGRVSVDRNGAVTITAGAHAGVSLGPASAGVEAGVYVTVDSSGIKDVGVTASSHNISLDVATAGYTASFNNVSNYASYLSQ